MKIIVIGSLNVDTTYQLPHIPVEGETILATSKSTQRGGKGQNQAVAMARLGAEVSMIGAVGNDDEGNMLIDGLKSEGVDATGIIRKDVPSGTASIYLDENARNNIVVYPGANFAMTVEDIDERLDLIKSAKICVMQNEIPKDVIYHVIEICRAEGIITVLNPAPAVKGFDTKYLGMVDYLIPNESELELLLGKKIDENVDELAREVLDLGCGNVLVTLGSKGSMLMNEDEIYNQAAKLVKAVDTTAAGDSFIGGFTTALAMGKDFKEAMEYGTKVSAIAVTKPGAVDSLPTAEEVENYVF